jgi:hypothetical protein
VEATVVGAEEAVVESDAEYSAVSTLKELEATIKKCKDFSISDKVTIAKSSSI